MKKFTLLSFFAFTFLATSSYAQVQPHAIGLRGGSGTFGSGAEISYQHGFGSANRLELDLGWQRGNSWNNGNGNGFGNSYYSMGLTGVYHWVWNLDGGLNWFAGLGGQVGFFDHKYYDDEDGMTIGAGGQIGIEYDFNDLGAPIQIGLDARPMWGLIGYYRNFGVDGAFSLRYTF